MELDLLNIMINSSNTVQHNHGESEYKPLWREPNAPSNETASIGLMSKRIEGVPIGLDLIDE